MNIFNKIHKMDEDWTDEAGIFKRSDERDTYQGRHVQIYNFLRSDVLKKFQKFDYKR